MSNVTDISASNAVADEMNMDTTKNEEEGQEEHLTELVVVWFALEDKIKEQMEVVKELRSEKKQIEDAILKVMEDQRMDVINTSKGNLMKCSKESKGALTPELITDFLTKSMEDAAKVQEIVTKMLDTRPTKSSVGIKKQVVKKGTKHLRQ